MVTPVSPQLWMTNGLIWGDMRDRRFSSICGSPCKLTLKSAMETRGQTPRQFATQSHRETREPFANCTLLDAFLSFHKNGGVSNARGASGHADRATDHRIVGRHRQLPIRQNR